MKSRLKQLREQRKAFSLELTKLMDDTDRSEGRGGREWNAEDQKFFDEKSAQISGLDNEINAALSFEALEKEENAAPPTLTQMERKDKLADAQARGDVLVLNTERFLRHGWKDFSSDEIKDIRNAMSTTTPSEGGYTVQSEVAAMLLETQKAFGGMREVATVQRTSKGNDVDWPTTDGTAEEGEIIAENQPATDLDVSFGTVNIGACKYSSKVVTIPWELVQDSEIDIEGMVRRRLGMRLARIENRHFTVGTGTAQPRGLVTASAVGKTGTTGQTLTVTYDDLIDLQHSIDPAYRTNAQWMMHDDSLKALYKLVDSDGRPLFWAASRDLSDPMPMTLLGRTININQHMPVMAANAKSILFGDLGTYLIRDVMAVTLFRFDDSAYVKKGQVGFLAWMRADGDHIDAGESVKHYANSAT